LTSGDLRLVRAGLLHLENAFIEYPNVFQATVPAMHYVVALLNGSLDGDPVVLNSMGRRWPLRAHLLQWLAGVVAAVSDAEVDWFVDLAGFSPLEHAIGRLVLPRCGIFWMFAQTRSTGNSLSKCSASWLRICETRPIPIPDGLDQQLAKDRVPGQLRRETW
jgi:hypothetical protein